MSASPLTRTTQTLSPYTAERKQETDETSVVVKPPAGLGNSSSRGCIICGATARDAAGTVKHEGACPLFMRGPEHGGDPHEWSTLFSI